MTLAAFPPPPGLPDLPPASGASPEDSQAQALSLPLQDLSCAACVVRAERALQAVPGVRRAQVNLATGQALVEAGPGLSLADLVEAAAQAGYPVPLESRSLALEGLSCAACVARVERALQAVPGVVEARVNLASEQALIRRLPGGRDAALEAALQAAGYGLRPQTPDALAPPAPGAGPPGGSPGPDRLSPAAAGVAAAQGPGQEGAAGGRLLAAWARAARAARGRDRETLTLALTLAAVLPLVLPMLAMPFGLHAMPPAWLQALLATPVQFLAGARFYRGAWRALRAGSGTMDQLVALGTSAAWGLSMAQWLGAAPGVEPALYFEASAVVIALVRLGKWLEGRAKRRTTEALRALQALRPSRARVWREGAWVELPVESLRVGERLALHPGERCPADARVEEGEAFVDESLLSGESRPLAKGPGDTLAAGALNLDGRLTLRAVAVGAETLLARIVRHVETAQAAKPPIQRQVDRVSAVFVPAVLGVAALTLLGWWAAGAAPSQAVLHAVAVLVIACPCALGLATPAAILAGVGAAARRGILVRDAEALERAASLRAVAFDKTGTLTEGRPQLVASLGADWARADAPAGPDRALLRLAAALQQASEHPLARAVRERAAAEGLSPPPAEALRVLPGRGVEARVEGVLHRLGNRRLLEESGASAAPWAEVAAAHEAQGLSLAWMIRLHAGETPRALGLLAFDDRLRPESREAIGRLHALGLRTLLLSGDHAGAAARVGAALGLDAVQAEVLPAGKAEALAALRAEVGGPVAMVGDGLNDAPALAAADVGFALGGGTDLAMASAGITLMRDDPRLVAEAIELSRRTVRILRQGLFWAFAYNVVGIPLAALGGLSPVLAGAAMAASSVSVLANALRLQRPASPGRGGVLTL